MSVGLVGEDDQVAINFAVITKVIVNTSSIAAKGVVPLQEQLNVNAILVLAWLYDKVPMYMLAMQNNSQCLPGTNFKSQLATVEPVSEH